MPRANVPSTPPDCASGACEAPRTSAAKSSPAWARRASSAQNSSASARERVVPGGAPCAPVKESSKWRTERSSGGASSRYSGRASSEVWAQSSARVSRTTLAV